MVYKDWQGFREWWKENQKWRNKDENQLESVVQSSCLDANQRLQKESLDDISEWQRNLERIVRENVNFKKANKLILES